MPSSAGTVAAASDQATILGIPADSITAVGTAIMAIATIALAVFALRQLSALIEQLKLAREADAKADLRLIESNTIRVCERIYSDPVISVVTQRIWVASKNGTDYRTAAIDGHDLITMLNYFDSIAIGIKQGVFSAAIVKDHMASAFIKIVDVLQPAVVPRLLPDWTGYEAITELRDSWRPKSAVSYRHTDSRP
jgi:hypothetical protein